MKTKITFTLDLSDPYDRQAFNRITKATDMASVLFEIAYNLQKQCNRECEALEADSDRAANRPEDGVYIVFRRIGELLEERGIRIEELIS